MKLYEYEFKDKNRNLALRFQELSSGGYVLTFLDCGSDTSEAQKLHTDDKNSAWNMFEGICSMITKNDSEDKIRETMKTMARVA